MTGIVLIRGGGDLATGVALRLFRAGYRVLIAELPQPLAVRRTVSFAEAVYEGQWAVEKILARRVENIQEILRVLETGEIPVLVDPGLEVLGSPSASGLRITALIDARVTKTPPGRYPVPFQLDSGLKAKDAPLVIGLGPGFNAGADCSAVVETMRGHTLGRVYWQGSAMVDTNQPEGDPRRVLRAPLNGKIHPHTEIGQRVEAGQILAEVRAEEAVRFITSPFAGILRGMIHPELDVTAGLKVGDVDARTDPSLCYLVSDKSLAIGGGVLEAILAQSASRSSQSSTSGVQGA